MLVTGGCGFIGSHLVESLLEDGYAVVVLDDLSSGDPAQLDPRAELRVGDVADPAAVAACFEGVSGCFHLAAIASVARSNADWIGSHRVTQGGTVCVLDAARRANAIPVVYASSAAVYGDVTSVPIRESAPTRPLTAYGADKLGSELHANVAWVVHRVPTIGLRFFNIYGPRQDPSSPYSGVISVFVDRIRAGQPLTIHGAGTQVRDFVHVGDAVRHLQAAMRVCTVGARVFNVCSGVGTSVSDLAQLLGTLLEAPLEMRTGPRRAGDIQRSIGAPERARSELAIRTEITIADGLRAMLTGAPVPMAAAANAAGDADH